MMKSTVKRVLCGRKCLIAVCVVLELMPLCWTHVALTFPPARKFDFDFLDNFRTSYPCGMPKGSIATSIQSGSSFNVTWYLGAIHKGGFKLEVLDGMDRPVMNLTPVTPDGEFIVQDVATQSYHVTIPPDFTCDGCSIRLVRQLGEITDRDFTFWSCADVDFVPSSLYVETCSGNGEFGVGICKCGRLYSGFRCQYKDDCADDSDCSNKGKCVYLEGNNYPRRQCYCERGWFGQQCERESSVKNLDVNLDDYLRKVLTADMHLYWRLVENNKEIEMIIVARTISYVGIGWKPQDIDPNCKAKFPVIPTDVRQKHPGSQATRGMAKPIPIGSLSPIDISTNQRSPKILEDEKTTFWDDAMFTSPTKFDAHTSSVETAATETSSASSEGHLNHSTDEWFSPSEGAFSTLSVENMRTDSSEKSSDFTTATDEGLSSVTNWDLSSAATFLINSFATTDMEHTASAVTEDELTSSFLNRTTGTERVQTSITSGRVSGHPSTIAGTTSESYDSDMIDNVTSAIISREEQEQSPVKIKETVLNAFDDSSSTAHHREKRDLTTEASSWTASSETSPQQVITTSANSEKRAKALWEEKQYIHNSDEHVYSYDHVTTPLTTEDTFTAQKSYEMSTVNEGGTSTTAEGKLESLVSVVEPQMRNDVFTREVKATTDFPVKQGKVLEDVHPMDCTDMIIGTARGQYFRLLDYYSRDRSTPKLDTYYGGTNSLTAAVGLEQEDQTIFLFRRKLESNESTDYTISNGTMILVWSKGQQPSEYIHEPRPGLENGPAAVKFYKPDHIKYHGHDENRGATTINFLEHSTSIPPPSSTTSTPTVSWCRGEWSYPPQCQVQDCDYRATWQLLPDGDTVYFTVSTKFPDKWTGIAFSKEGKMPNTDAIIGWVEPSGRAFIMDTWISGYSMPILDERQDVMNFTGTRINGITLLTFTRKRDTGDPQDLPFTDTDCPYLTFPFSTNNFNGINKKIRKHDRPPAVPFGRVCLRKCPVDYNDHSGSSLDLDFHFRGVPAGPHIPTQTDAGGDSTYVVSIRLLEQNFSNAINSDDVDVDQLLRNTIKYHIADSLKKIPGFKDVIVAAFESDRNQSGAIAKMNVVFNNDLLAAESVTTDRQLKNSRMGGGYVDLEPEPIPEEFDDFGPQPNLATYIEQALNQTVTSGKIGNLLIDKSYLFVQSPYENDSKDVIRPVVMRGDSLHLAIWVIIVSISALAFLAVVQVTCTIYQIRKSKNRTRHAKEKYSRTTPPWRDYMLQNAGSNGGNLNYAYRSYEDESPNSNRLLLQTQSTGRSSRPYLAGPYTTGADIGLRSNISGFNGGGGLPPAGMRFSYAEPRNGSEFNADHYSRRAGSLLRPGVNGQPLQVVTSTPNVGGASGYSASANKKSRSGGANHQHSKSAPANGQQPLNPDFYFMPSQRKYSGEVVRVYVDYNNKNNK